MPSLNQSKHCLAAVWVGCLALGSPAVAAAPVIESRAATGWPTQNHYRFPWQSAAPKGRPVWVDIELPAAFSPDSVRVYGAAGPLPAKVDWRMPRARIAWLSDGTGKYNVYFDHGRDGETERLIEPAMIGAGDRLTFGRRGVRAPLSVGLWAHPAAVDVDGDGDIDLVVSCPDRPFNGTYLFRNLGGALFDRGQWMGRGHSDMVAADFNGDGAVDLVVSGGYYSDVRRRRMSRFVKVDLPRSYWIGRDDLWFPVDWDRDGRIDVLAGTSDWRDYGWDDAWDDQGRWTRGRLHGYVYFHRNLGTNEQPRYAEPRRLEAGGAVLDQYGSPAPNPVDWFGSGRWDLIAGEFLDSLTLFRNNGRGLDSGVKLTVGGRPLRMNLCMIQPRVVFWHPDGRPSLLVAEEDGRVSLVENLAPKGQEPRLAAPRFLMQAAPFVKSGALSRPVAVDLNADGLLDLVSGNSGGYIQYFENTGTPVRPEFTDRGYLEADGKVIRHMAGERGSIQGPAEAKWGYTNPWAADWDLDGKLDLMVNDIRGEVVWYPNLGTVKEPRFGTARPVEVEWKGKPLKPDWVWWEPEGKSLVTQWRTTPRVVDWDRDGLPDLVMLDYRGYLALYRRARIGGELKLLPPERVFLEPNGRFLMLSAGRGGRSGRRKVDTVDWDGDGDLDLITDSDEGPAWYENTGSQAKPVMKARGTILKAKLAGHNPTPNAADWNGDGKLDLLIGAEDGFFYYFERSYIEAARPSSEPRP